jgi:ectoine hydroxylase-related dioxygenase (phytanoyl-CoA dioxygenase family)
MELHPLNCGFRWRVPAGPYRRITRSQARAYDEHGYFLLENAFDGATVEAIRAEIDPWEQKATDFLRTRPGGRLFIADAEVITFTVHLVARSRYLRELCRGRLFQDLGHDLVGPDVRLYWDQAVYKKPESGRTFPWHQDNGYNFVQPQQYLTCWIALTDATLENGCPWVVPGIHRQGTLRHWPTDAGWQCLREPEGAVPIPAKAGSIVVFSSLTPHRTGPNRTAEVRKAYIVQLAPEGAMVLSPGPEGGEPLRTTQTAPERQFPILVHGTGAADELSAQGPTGR